MAPSAGSGELFGNFSNLALQSPTTLSAVPGFAPFLMGGSIPGNSAAVLSSPLQPPTVSVGTHDGSRGSAFQNAHVQQQHDGQQQQTFYFGAGQHPQSQQPSSYFTPQQQVQLQQMLMMAPPTSDPSFHQGNAASSGNHAMLANFLLQQQMQQAQLQELSQAYAQQQAILEAAAAFVLQQQQQQQQSMPTMMLGQGSAPGSTAAEHALVALQAQKGRLTELARTPSGSSTIQAILKDHGATDPRVATTICEELFPAFGDLMLDSHGCYVAKTLLDNLPPQAVHQLLSSVVANDPQLGYSLCIHSLHTRRVVQHIIDTYDPSFLLDVLIGRCADVATTQQGCIVMQRSMDRAPPGPKKDALTAMIHKNFLAFAKDPFANYVVQHLLEIGDRERNSEVVSQAVAGRVVELSCNKFASNVMEKCLFHVTAEVQHQILHEMYTSGSETLINMLGDSFGNYIIQSSIALATFRDVWFINDHLRPVLRHTPYGHKIESRLDRRMKGKAVQAKVPGSVGFGDGDEDGDNVDTLEERRPARPGNFAPSSGRGRGSYRGGEGHGRGGGWNRQPHHQQGGYDAGQHGYLSAPSPSGMHMMQQQQPNVQALDPAVASNLLMLIQQQQQQQQQAFQSPFQPPNMQPQQYNMPAGHMHALPPNEMPW